MKGNCQEEDLLTSPEIISLQQRPTDQQEHTFSLVKGCGLGNQRLIPITQLLFLATGPKQASQPAPASVS